MRRALDVRSARDAFALAADQSAAGHGAQVRQAGVRRDRHLEHDAVLPAILRHVADANARSRRR